MKTRLKQANVRDSSLELFRIITMMVIVATTIL